MLCAQRSRAWRGSTNPSSPAGAVYLLRASAWSSLNGAYLPQVDASLTGSGTTLSTSVASLVQAWVNSPASNKGLLLERDLTASAPSCFSSDYATAANRPKLVVCYAD